MTTGYSPPTVLGTAAVSWISPSPSPGIMPRAYWQLSIRVFFVNANKNLVMASYDDPDVTNSAPKSINWVKKVVTIDGQTLGGIPTSVGDAITAVSVYPNTDKHEIHVFYVAPGVLTPGDRRLQSVILNVKTKTWFRDVTIDKLQTGDCPSAAVGWESEGVNEFRLYCGREQARTWGSITNDIVEYAYTNNDWIRGNSGKAISWDIEETMRDNGDAYTTRVAACTWMDSQNKRQIRLYRNTYDTTIAELIWSAEQPNSLYGKWQRGGDYSSNYFNSRGNPTAALVLTSDSGAFSGIRHYGYRALTDPSPQRNMGFASGPMTWNELAWDQSANKWSEQLLPFQIQNFQAGPQGGIEKEEAKIPFSCTSWRIPNSNIVGIRIYRVAYYLKDPKIAQIDETSYNGNVGGGWKYLANAF